MSYQYDLADFKRYLQDRNRAYRVDGLIFWQNRIPLPIDLFNRIFDESDQIVTDYIYQLAASTLAFNKAGAFEEKLGHPVSDLPTLRHADSYLQGHPNMNLVPGVDMSTGSLGQGVSCAAGMAKGAKYLNEDVNVYTLLGDGEIEEGQVWEAFMFAAHFKLDNLCVIIDLNGLQIDGPTEKVMNSAPVDAKMEAFGFNVITIDGHDYDQIEGAFNAFRACTGKPTAILMHTTKGKGVSYMENSVDWHGKAPNDAEYEVAMGELRAAMAELEA